PDGAFHGFVVDAVLDDAGAEHAGHDRGCRERVRPRYRLTRRVQPGAKLMRARRAVLVVLHVVLARPHHLYRGAGGLGRLELFLDEIELEPPAEAAAQICRVYLHLLGRHAADLGAEALRTGLELRRSPDVDPVGTDVRGAVHRL